MDTSSQNFSEVEISQVLSALPECSAAELRYEISTHRAALVETINDLDERFQQVVDWRTHVGAHPYVAVGIAASIGLWATTLFKRKLTPKERMLEAMAESVEHICGESSRQFGSLLSRVTPQRSSGLRGLLLGLATQAVTTYLKGQVGRPARPITHQTK